MKTTFALALALIGVEAGYQGGYGGYGGYNSHAPRYTTPTHYPAGGYGGPHGPQSQVQHTHPTPTYNPWENVHTHDKDADDDDVDKSTWYSPYQQYSPPKIEYKVISAKTTQYAACEINENNRIQFAQIPGKPPMVRVNFQDLDPDTKVAFKFNEYGRALGSLGGPLCDNVGNEFNPLSELDSLGRVNPYQDPSRGNIDMITADSNGDIDNEIQKELLQNLSGHDSLIGRSVSVFDVADDGTQTLIGCCNIGYDKQPASSATAPTHHHHQPSYGHGSSYGYQPPSYGHGSYGRPSYGYSRQYGPSSGRYY